MPIFTGLLSKMLPLVSFIAAGVIAVRYIHVERETIARLLLYIFSTAVVFYGTFNTQLTLSLLALPVIFFVLCSALALVFWKAGGLLWEADDSTRNLLGFTAGSGNTGYFGLPVGLLIFGEKALGPIVLCILGYILYENSIGFFIAARGNFTVKESLMRMLRLPALYAFVLGIAMNFTGIAIGGWLPPVFENLKGTYTVLGMMMIGMGLATASFSKIDWKLLGCSFFAKFAAWPAAVAGLIWADARFFHLFSADIRGVIFLMGLVPLAANTVAFATVLKIQPEKAAMTVVASTLFAMLYIPFMLGLYL